MLTPMIFVQLKEEETGAPKKKRVGVPDAKEKIRRTWSKNMWAHVPLPAGIELPDNWMDDPSWANQLAGLKAGDTVVVIPAMADKISRCSVEQQFHLVPMHEDEPKAPEDKPKRSWEDVEEDEEDLFDDID